VLSEHHSSNCIERHPWHPLGTIVAFSAPLRSMWSHATNLTLSPSSATLSLPPFITTSVAATLLLPLQSLCRTRQDRIDRRVREVRGVRVGFEGALEVNGLWCYEQDSTVFGTQIVSLQGILWNTNLHIEQPYVGHSHSSAPSLPPILSPRCVLVICPRCVTVSPPSPVRL
jgi:hypothetical protein